MGGEPRRRPGSRREHSRAGGGKGQVAGAKNVRRVAGLEPKKSSKGRFQRASGWDSLRAKTSLKAVAQGWSIIKFCISLSP